MRFKEWFRAKQQSKDDLTSFLKGFCDVEIVKDSIFDMLVKRIHEYKRQLLAVLYVVWQYFRLQRVNAVSIKKHMSPLCFLFSCLFSLSREYMVWCSCVPEMPLSGYRL